MKIYSCPQCLKEFRDPIDLEEGEFDCGHCGRTIIVLSKDEGLSSWKRVFVKSV